MLTTLLVIVIIISCKTITRGFAKLPKRMILFSKTKLNVRLTSTTFYDEDRNDKRKNYKKYNYDLGSVSDYNFNFNNHLLKETIILPNNENDDHKELDNQKIDNYKEIDNQKIDNYETLYTLIWFNCEDCTKLLNDVKNDGKKILYIDGSYYFFDENDETNTPMFYKNDELIATDLFSIYEELFYNKIVE